MRVDQICHDILIAAAPAMQSYRTRRLQAVLSMFVWMSLKTHSSSKALADYGLWKHLRKLYFIIF